MRIMHSIWYSICRVYHICIFCNNLLCILNKWFDYIYCYVFNGIETLSNSITVIILVNKIRFMKGSYFIFLDF